MTSATRLRLAPTRPQLRAATPPARRLARRVLGYTGTDWAKILLCWFVIGPAVGVLLGVVLVTAFKEGTPSPAEPMPASVGGGPVPALTSPAAPSVQRAPTVTRVPPRTTKAAPSTTSAVPVAPPAVTRTVTAPAPAAPTSGPAAEPVNPPADPPTVPADGGSTVPNPPTGDLEPPA